MSDAVLERFIRQYIAQQDVQEINFSWQGGEPTLLGIDFFEKAVHFQKLYCPPTKRVVNDLQTNGTLLDEDWCRFLHENRFLVGISIDGPQKLHDIYRVDRNGQGTFNQVISGIRNLQKQRVEFNTLTVVNKTNARYPLDVYHFLRDELGSKYLQFIPCVEPVDFKTTAPGNRTEPDSYEPAHEANQPESPNSVVTEWSVHPEDYGTFLCTIFDEWLQHDIGTVFVPLFDNALGQWLGLPSSTCYFSEICGKALALEHDGSVYACDHYVYPEYKRGNIREKTLAEMVYSEQQACFGLDKQDRLPGYCKDCKVLFACNGECPKNRLLRTPDGEPGLNYLCSGLWKFFHHIDPWMKQMAEELRAGRPAVNIMRNLENKTIPVISPQSLHRPSRKQNVEYPCDNGYKSKKCHYPNNPASISEEK